MKLDYELNEVKEVERRKSDGLTKRYHYKFLNESDDIKVSVSSDKALEFVEGTLFTIEFVKSQTKLEK